MVGNFLKSWEMSESTIGENRLNRCQAFYPESGRGRCVGFRPKEYRFYELTVLLCTFNLTLVLLWACLQANFRIRGWLLNHRPISEKNTSWRD